jgi:hypothetical protein
MSASRPFCRRLYSLIPGLGVKLSTIILAGSQASTKFIVVADEIPEALAHAGRIPADARVIITGVPSCERITGQELELGHSPWVGKNRCAANSTASSCCVGVT